MQIFWRNELYKFLLFLILILLYLQLYDFFTITIEGSAIDHSMNNIIGDNKFLTYENTDYVIKIDYSANWIYQNIFTKYKIDIYQVVEWQYFTYCKTRKLSLDNENYIIRLHIFKW